MIQPLHPSRVEWVLDWVDLEEPAGSGDLFFLPTCVFVLHDNPEPVVGQEILRELDQRRAENLLARLFHERGAPDEIVIPESPDWEPRAWKEFAQDMGCTIRLVRTNDRRAHPLLAMIRRVKDSLARRLVESAGVDLKTTPRQRVAEGLVECAAALQSRAKRLATLEKAVELYPRCATALLELADLDYQDGNFKMAMARFEKVAAMESGRTKGRDVRWWEDVSTRPFLRSLYGQMLVHWQMGQFDQALDPAERLLDLNPGDNQGVRFFLPMLYLLAERAEDADAFFKQYETTYAGDYPEPAVLFAWGLTCGMFGDEAKALEKYRQGMLRNLYIAPLLLDLPEPPRDLWHPGDRSEPHYAGEFVDSYAGLWDRDTAHLRLLREAYDRTQPEIERLVELRRRMADFQDQRFNPDHQKHWQKFLDEEKQLLDEP